MRKILCTIPEGTLSQRQIQALESSLKDNYAAQFGNADKVIVIWCALPHGQGYTEGRISNVSVVLVEVENGLAQQKRETAMMIFAEAWARIADIDIHQLLVTFADSAVFGSFLNANRNRIRWYSRPAFVLSTLANLWRSRQRDGYLSIPANLKG